MGACHGCARSCAPHHESEAKASSTVVARRESPEQHGELADGPEVRLRIEGYYLRFVVWLVHVRRVQVETARKYLDDRRGDVL